MEVSINSLLNTLTFMRTTLGNVYALSSVHSMPPDPGLEGNGQKSTVTRLDSGKGEFLVHVTFHCGVLLSRAKALSIDGNSRKNGGDSLRRGAEWELWS